MPTQSSQTSPSRYEKDFNAVFEILLDMSKQNGMMFKQYTSLAQQQLLLGQSLKQLLSAKISIFSPGSGVSKDKSSHKTTSSQTEWRIDEAIPQFDGNQSLDTQSEESLPLHGGVLPQVNLGHTSCTEDCCQTTLDGESGVDVSLVQSTGDTKPPRRARRRKKRKHNTEKLSKVSQAVQAIHNVAALAGWSEAKLQHELRVFKSKNEKSALSALPNCQKRSNKNCHNTSKVKESLNTVVLPPFPHPMNVPPPCLVPNPRQQQKSLYKKWPARRFSSPSPQQYLNKALPQPITTRTQDFPPERDQSCMSQDRLQTLYFYRSHPPFQKSRFENSTPVEFWRREL